MVAGHGRVCLIEQRPRRMKEPNTFLFRSESRNAHRAPAHTCADHGVWSEQVYMGAGQDGWTARPRPAVSDVLGFGHKRISFSFFQQYHVLPRQQRGS